MKTNDALHYNDETESNLLVKLDNLHNYFDKISQLEQVLKVPLTELVNIIVKKCNKKSQWYCDL